MTTYNEAIIMFFCVWTIALVGIGLIAHFAWRSLHDDNSSDDR